MKLAINGVEADVDDRHSNTPLLWVLRDVLGMRGTKFGCGAGFCAACTVLIDGRNVKSCQTATERAVGKAVTTVEGASGPVVNAVRDAWHRRNVVQCGYCQPGQTLAAVSLLESDPSPDEAKIDQWMSGNLCRCGTYPRIRAAIHEAAETLSTGIDPGELTAPAVPEFQRLTPQDAADPVHPYVRIREDGTVVAYSSQIEMGQGIHTGLATIVVEELDAEFERVRVVKPYWLQTFDRASRERGWRQPTRAQYDAEIAHGAMFVGSPETVAQRIAPVMRALDVDRIDLHYALGQVPAGQRRESIELLGREVFPRVRELLKADPGKHDAPAASAAPGGVASPVRSTHAPAPSAR